MALTEREIIDQIEIRGEQGIMQVRKAIIVERDGVEISRTFHRHVVEPDADVTEEDSLVKVFHKAIPTKIKDDYVTKKAAREAARIAEEEAARIAEEEAARIAEEEAKLAELAIIETAKLLTKPEEE